MEKSKNSNLHAAKSAKNDEFYTQYNDIAEELKHYKEHFKGKVVYCNCDDPEWSHFWKYFHNNFRSLGLKKLIATHYAPRYDVSYAKIYKGGDDFNMDAGKTVDIYGNDGFPPGDFRSDDSIQYLEECDICCTNPPFSLFRPFVSLLMEHEKKFLIIGNQNAITYKEIFPFIKENKIWLGSNFVKEFRQPDGTIKKFGNICWFTNIDLAKRHEKLILWKSYSSNDYPKYDNYDAINVDKITEIPINYEGVMGVPITFLHKYCPEQFEIINLSRYLEGKRGMTKKFVDDYYENGGTAQICEGHPDLCFYDNNGNPVVPYMRILVRYKNDK